MRIGREKGDILGGLDRSPAEQAAENLAQALRVLEMIPQVESTLTPHPVVVLRAELENARRYLALVQEGSYRKTRVQEPLAA